ncbi:uncharacterized protein PGTG_22192 [Puccinia graminis f. sp. tritici CRL 75-36-700-3]|uniref:Uncharacterized protein n=1 Tax=Puccinia graminis f. sp. tritici (strain CRL 75-36-700-3 / race SCCL) TaxID=418459 RepID=H6QTT7_PUCGT|nr:uncharacterized protein PGTG_22192 [Puccinia graminis f. sp. tritici CRL 75-36-700-3]EHS64368.1 hypothetical protein PGTG_22192 [Puccinia graminis f. sp. tritici CRL 75-36-700-3]
MISPGGLKKFEMPMFGRRETTQPNLSAALIIPTVVARILQSDAVLPRMNFMTIAHPCKIS